MNGVPMIQSIEAEADDVVMLGCSEPSSTQEFMASSPDIFSSIASSAPIEVEEDNNGKAELPSDSCIWVEDTLCEDDADDVDKDMMSRFVAAMQGVLVIEDDGSSDMDLEEDLLALIDRSFD